MNKLDHLAREEMLALKNGQLSVQRRLTALEHIGECDLCAAAFSELYLAQDLPELPAGFQSSVMAAIEKEKRITETQQRILVSTPRTEVKTQQTSGAASTVRRSKTNELFRYGFKVSVAACITLFLLFSGTISHGMDLSRSIHTNISGMNTITENMKSLSDKLIDFKFTKNIKEEE